MSRKVDLNFVMKLQKIFKDKKWMEDIYSDHAFESLCSLSVFFEDDKEKESLFIELLERYNWMSLSEYTSNLKKLMDAVFSHFTTPVKKFYTFPIIKPEDEKANKSGNAVSYMMKCNLPFVKGSNNAIMVELTNFAQFEGLILKDNEYIILVDDFIGSGETLNACMSEILKIAPDLTSKIIVACVVIQSDTIGKITIPLFYNLAEIRGISDNYASPLKEKNINLMLTLESKLISGRNFSLGYEQSEGLVTLMRTPDNTFPIFWHKYKSSIGFNPPFPRN